MKEGEGVNLRTYMKDPWTWTTVWGVTMEMEVGLGGGSKGGEMGHL